jgi:hypothetical protein
MSEFTGNAMSGTGWHSWIRVDPALIDPQTKTVIIVADPPKASDEDGHSDE